MYGIIIIDNSEFIFKEISSWELVKKQQNCFLIQKLKESFSIWKGTMEKKFFSPKNHSIFFDSGTYFKQLEVRVSDMFGNSLLPVIFEKHLLNERLNLVLANDITNNYGELLGCFLAMIIAKRLSVEYVAGDSQIVIFFILDNAKKNSISEELCQKTRKFYEKNFFNKVQYINRAKNPADLRFLL